MQTQKVGKVVLMLVWLVCAPMAMVYGQEARDSVMREDWKRNWFVQMGADMTLQLPYGHRALDTFKDGISVGVDAALGRWFTPEVGLRGRVNWENGIIDSKADWLAPFYEKGENHRKGGYICIVGDVLLDVHNLIWGYDPDRRWNMQVFPRAGITYNFGVSKGSPLIGVGIGNTYRVSDRWKVYCDVVYNGVSSGHTGVETGTGIGTGSNGFVNVEVGVQYCVGGSRVSNGSKVSEGFRVSGSRVSCFNGDNSLKGKGFWKNWFLEMGADMTLLNPYGMDFGDVFPHGASMGLDGALGKWFSPMVALRGRLNWKNALIENRNADWYAYDPEKYESNYEGKGCAMAYLDVLLSAKHAFMGYREGERWDMYVFPRCGLGSNLALDSMSPLVGAGIGGSYRMNDRWSLYAETAYMGITSEFFSGVSGTGMGVSTGFNGIWDFQVGVRLGI